MKIAVNSVEIQIPSQSTLLKADVIFTDSSILTMENKASIFTVNVCVFFWNVARTVIEHLNEFVLNSTFK